VNGHQTDALEAQAIKAYTQRDWPLAERLYREVIDKADLAGVQSARNMLGKILERLGRVDEAITLYEANVSDGFDGEFPYLCLAIIYRKRRQTENEVRVLERGIAVMREHYGADGGPDLKLRLARLQA